MNEQPKIINPEQGGEQKAQDERPTPGQMDADALRIGDEIKILWDKVPADLRNTPDFFDIAEGFKGDARAFAKARLKSLKDPNPKGWGEFHALEDMQRLKEQIANELGSEEVEAILRQAEERKKAEQKKERQEDDQKKLERVRNALGVKQKTPGTEGDNDKYGIKGFFESGSFRESYAKPAIEYAHRVSAAEAGTPIKTGDTDKKQLDFLRREAGTFKEGFFGGKEEVAKQERELRDLKMPELLELFRKDENGKLLKNEPLIEKYKWAVASAPLVPDGVRDFRQTKQFEVSFSSSGGVLFSTDKKFAHERFIYDLPILSLALFAESEDGDKGFTTLPYLIGGKDKKIVAKGLLILNAEQRKKLREVVTARLG